jgi:hypothetical protein
LSTSPLGLTPDTVNKKQSSPMQSDWLPAPEGSDLA